MEVRRAQNGHWYTLEALQKYYDDEEHVKRVWEDCQLIVKGRPVTSYMESTGDERDAVCTDGNTSIEASIVTDGRVEVRRARDDQWYTLEDFKACFGDRYGRVIWAECQAVVRGAVVSSYMEATGDVPDWGWEEGGASEHVAKQSDASEEAARGNVRDRWISLTCGASEHTVQLVIQKQYDIDEVAVTLLEDIVKEELGKLRDFEFEMRLAWMQQHSSDSPYSGQQKKRSWSGLICTLERAMLSYLQASSVEHQCVCTSLNDCVASVLEKHRRIHGNTNSDPRIHHSSVRGQNTLVSAMQRLFALLKMKVVLRHLVQEFQFGNRCKNDVLKVVQQWQVANHSDIEEERRILKGKVGAFI